MDDFPFEFTVGRGEAFEASPLGRDSARTALWVGNVGLGLAVAALATAVVLYAVRPEAARASGPVRLSASSGGLRVAW